MKILAISLLLVGCMNKPPSVQHAEPAGLTQFGLINIVGGSRHKAKSGDQGDSTGVDSTIGRKNADPLEDY